MALPFLQTRLHIKLTLAQLLLLSGWLLMLAYIGWEYYWYTKVDWHFVQWHTHLAPYAGLLLLLFTLTQWVHIHENKLLILASTCMALMLAEGVLLALNTLPDAAYVGQFTINPHNYYHTWPPNNQHYLKNEEYNFLRTTNALGFSDKEWSVQKDSGKLRILTLGDSFTEGDAAPADSAYPFLLQQLLGKQYEVMNAGNCGSDPVFNYKNLEDHLLKYAPDVVIQTISAHDLFTDIALCGGFERFLPGGMVYNNPPPAWFYPATVSLILRKVLKLFSLDEHKPITNNDAFLNKLKGIQQQLISKYDSLGKKHQFQTLVLILPLRHETQWNKYDYDFSPLVNMAEATATVQTFDLLPCYQSHIQNTTRNYQTYYWVIDAHHNSRGYHMMAQCVYEKLITMLPSKDTTLLSAQ